MTQSGVLHLLFAEPGSCEGTSSRVGSGITRARRQLRIAFLFLLPNPPSLQIHTTLLNSHPLHTSFPPPQSITLSPFTFPAPPFLSACITKLSPPLYCCF
ncbi:hypothetical protein I312_104677 [Cryptococcus bacillisporus CA1280]|uniref:uncharacterized protein n=1 Tax=Cryptococcus bacillisporus CA1280 TaxID=1296109 RepID=UPI0033664824